MQAATVAAADDVVTWSCSATQEDLTETAGAGRRWLFIDPSDSHTGVIYPLTGGLLLRSPSGLPPPVSPPQV